MAADAIEIAANMKTVELASQSASRNGVMVIFSFEANRISSEGPLRMVQHDAARLQNMQGCQDFEKIFLSSERRKRAPSSSRRQLKKVRDLCRRRCELACRIGAEPPTVIFTPWHGTSMP